MNPTCGCVLGAGLAHYPSCSYQAPPQTTSPHWFPVSRFNQIHYLHICSCMHVHVCMNMHVCILMCACVFVYVPVCVLQAQVRVRVCTCVCAIGSKKNYSMQKINTLCIYVHEMDEYACMYAYLHVWRAYSCMRENVGCIQTICKPMPTLTPGKVTCKLTCCKSSKQMFPWAC